MRVKDKKYRTVWMNGSSVFLIEQNLLPFEFKIFESKTYQTTCKAIKTMVVRGAGAIGATAGFAMAQAFLQKADIKKAKKEIEATRPTAQNLFYAVNRVFNASDPVKEAQLIADEDVDNCKKIGEIGNELIKDGYNIETPEKAIVAKEYGVPFYVAAPSSTFDLKCKSGQDIPIEQRSEDEVLYQTGPNNQKILVCAPGSSAINPAFDVTPAKFITGIITEKGLIKHG